MFLAPLFLSLTLALAVGLLWAPCAEGATSLSDVIVLGPFLGTYPPTNPDLVGGTQYLEGALSDSSGLTIGNVSLALTIWAHPAGAAKLRVTKQKYFTLFKGQISALGTILLPNVVYNASSPSASVSFYIPLAGGTGKFFGATGVLNTTSTNIPNEVRPSVLLLFLLLFLLLPPTTYCPPSSFPTACHTSGTVHVHVCLAAHPNAVDSPLLVLLTRDNLSSQ